MTLKYEYRVVSQRVETKKKYTKYASLQAAKRRLELLTTDKPWEVMRPAENPDDYFCCAGGYGEQCGCGGISIRDHFTEEMKQYPKLLSAEIERRQVGDWREL